MNRISITKGKRAKNGNKRKLTIGIIILIIIILLLIILKFTIFKQDNIVTNPDNISDQSNEIENQIAFEGTDVVKEDEIVSVEDWPKTMTAKTNVKYYVIGKIVIDKIGVEKYILDRTTDNSLDLAVTRFVEERQINEVGNFCITGHNYKGIFKKLKDLKIGDEFYLIGTDGRKVTYVIYDIYSIDPVNEECLDQNNNGKREVTLITCDPGAVTRLILKAEEKI